MFGEYVTFIVKAYVVGVFVVGVFVVGVFVVGVFVVGVFVGVSHVQSWGAGVTLRFVTAPAGVVPDRLELPSDVLLDG